MVVSIGPKKSFLFQRIFYLMRKIFKNFETRRTVFFVDIYCVQADRCHYKGQVDGRWHVTIVASSLVFHRGVIVDSRNVMRYITWINVSLNY